MPFNGTGTFIRPYNWVNDKNNAINITASRMDGDSDGFATGLSTCITKDGQQTTTVRIPFAQGLSWPSGSIMAAGLSLTGDITTGIYSSAAATVDIVAGGVRVGGFNSTGLYNTAIAGGAGSFTTLAVSGAATLSSTLAVTGTTALTGALTTAAQTLANAGIKFPVGAANGVEYLTSSSGAGYGFRLYGFDPGTGTVLRIAARNNNASFTDYFTITDSGAVTIAQTLGVTGAATFSGGAALGVATATTPAAADNSTKVATTAFVNGTALTLASGTTAVTQAIGTNNTTVATTAFVLANAGIGITALGLGSIALLRNQTGGSLAANSSTVYSASNLVVYFFATGGALTTTGDTITGTWKALQGTANNGYGLFLRTA